MPRYGTIVVIKRNGTDGIVFPLTSTSCLFGRKSECDIRMRLPWVSNEHCRIEINENKEAVLTNLSSVNPTQLNGACFEQPVPLKHGDVLTIIDRSFRFEYPLQSTPKRKRSRSPKDETLQVLHVQQVAEVELLHKQPPGPKSLDASDNAECEEKNANEKKQTPEKNLPEAFPVKLPTPKSSQRIHRVLKKQNEMSPFSKLYESVKNELKVEKPLHRRSSSQQAAKGDPGSVLPAPSAAPVSSQNGLFDLGSLDKRKESSRMENTEKCIIVRKEEEKSPGFNQLSAGGKTPRRSFTRSPQAPISKEVSGDSSQSPLQDPKGLRTPGRSRSAAVTPRPSKENQRSSLVLLEQCSIERFECPVQRTVCSPSSCRAAGGAPCVLSTPTPRRKSPRSPLVSPPRESSGMNPGTPRTPRRGSLKLKALPEIPAAAPREDPVCRIENTQLPLPEEKSLKQRRNSKQQTPGKPAQEVLKEIWDQANLDSSKVGHCETPASLSDSKSPRRSRRESKEFLDKSAHSEALATEGMLASPAGQTPGRKRGRQRSSGVLAETALEPNTAQEQHNSGRKASGTPAELARDGCHPKQDLEDTGGTRPQRPSGRRAPGCAAELGDTEPGSETKTFGLLHGEDSDKTKRIPQKRKSGETLPQTLGKRKRVSFGGHLSPELFDKSLPPNSPLKRGALPARRSLPHGNSPRAVLKKAQSLKHLIDQEEKKSPKNCPAQQSPGASSPVSTPRIPAGSPAPFRKGHFSISQPPTPFPIAEEKDAGTEDVDPEGKSGVQGKTPKSSPAARDAKASVAGTPARSARGAQLRLKGSAMRSRGGAVAVISAKRRSGASSANLLVAKSWAEVVKLGVARSQPKTAKKTVRKGRALKRLNHPPKTPEKKIKGHFSTGHAESPAAIVVGRAYSTTVRSAGHVPKVVKNPKLKLNMGMDESFTGVPEMFQTPTNQGGRTLPLAAAQNADVTPPWAAGDISDLHTPEESGEMLVSPLNNSDASEQKQESPGIFHLLREESSPSMFDEMATKTPEKRKAVHKDTVDGLPVTPAKPASLVKSGSKGRTPKQKVEPVEVMSSKRKILRTPEQRSEPGEALSGIKRLMKTPKQKLEPVEVLSGIKQLLKTPDQKVEPVEVLSGTKHLLKTPNQKLELVEVLSGTKHLLKTPDQKLEPVEVLSGIKQLLKTPDQKLEPVEVLSGTKHLLKTPNQKLEPVEVLSGTKHLLKTPNQKLEPVEVLSGTKHLLKTPNQKLEPVEVLSGIRQLLKTPKQKLEPVEVLSGIKQLLKTPDQKLEPVEVLSGIRQLLKTPKQKLEPVEVLSGIKQLLKTPDQKLEPVEVLSGTKHLLKTPNQKLELVEVLSGTKHLLKTPNQKLEPVEVLSGIKQLLKTPKQKLEPTEVLSGIKQLLKTPDQKLEPVEVLSGTKHLLKTPNQKFEPVEVLSGIKQLFKTPKQKLEPTEVLSGIKQLLKTPKQKLEPTEVLSGIKQLLKTPKQKVQPVEALSGIKHLMRTPKQKLEPTEVLSGIKHVLKTPKQKLEPVEALSGIKHLMRTPRRKAEPVENLSGIKQLLRTPQQELEPVMDEIALKRLLETPVESREAVKAVPGVTSARKSPKLKSQPVEDMVGISRIFQTPKEKAEPVENMFGIKRLMKSPKEKYEPVEDFVGLQRLMAEPKQKSSDSEVDYAGVTEMFGTPEEMKVRSVNVMDSQGEIASPGSNSSHKHEEKGRVSRGEDSQQKDSTGEEQPTQRPRRGRRAVPPAAAKPSENGVSSKELQSPDTQEEMGVITPENKGRGRRTKRCIQEVVPKCPDQEGLDIVSSVEPPGAAQSPGRGKRKELKELKHPNEHLESCVEDSSVLPKAPANTKCSLQDCGTNETEDDPGTKTGAGNIQSEMCQLQTGVNNPDGKVADSGMEDSEEVLLSPRRTRRGVESTEPVIPPRRGRRARNDQGKAASSGDLHGTTRKLRKDPSPKVPQRQEQACDKAPEAVTAQESENGTKLELKATERRVKSLRSTRNRKHSPEIKADTHGVTHENPQNIQKTEETSTETDAETQSHMKNKMKGSQGYETENAQENTTEAARRLKAESPSAETNKMPVSAEDMEANRARNRRGKKDSLEQKTEEFTENVNSLKPIAPKFKSEVDESSLQDSVGFVCVSAAQGREEQPSPGAPSVPAADSASPAQGTQRRTRNERGILKAKQTETLQSNSAQKNAVVSRRGRGKKVNFQLEESSSKAIEGKGLPEGDEGTTDKDNQHESSENPPSQGRRGRRKQPDSIPQKASPAFMEKQTLSADHRTDEAVVQEAGSALEAAPSSAEDKPPRRGRRREVAAASQSRSPSVRTRRGQLEGDAKQMAQREEENPALGNKTSQAKVNAPARDRRKKMDPAAEARSSTPLQGKCGLSETKGEGTQEEQSVPLEAVSCAKEKAPGRGRRKEPALASHTTNSISLRGKRRLPAGDGEEAPKEEQNVPLETCDPSGKENQLRRGRRKEIAPLVEAKSSVQGNQVLSKQSGRKNNREAKQNLDNSSQENMELVKGSSRQETTSLALSPTSLQGLPEDGKDRIPEEKSKLLDIAPPAKENPSRVGRKKTTSSTSEETISTSLRGKPSLPRGRGQKRVLQESEDASLENNPCQGRTRQLRNNRRKVEVSLEAATSTSPHKSSDLPGNGSTLGTQDLSGASTGSEENQSGKGQEGAPAPQAAPTSRRRRCQQPAEDVLPKKLKSGNDENGSLQRGSRNKTKLGEEDARAAQTTGGMERRTRSSTRTRK